MSDRETNYPPVRKFSLQRVLWSIAPLALLTAVAIGYLKTQEREAVRLGEDWAAKRFGLTNPANNRLAPDYSDNDNDLLADRPAPELCKNPDALVLSFIPGDGTRANEAIWSEFIEHLRTQTGKEVEFRTYRNVDEQVIALAEGELHITAVNTGAVPLAVNASGFVPHFVVGAAESTFGYTMKIIVPKDSPIQSIKDIAGNRITFTSTDSNSGFKAPVVMLMYDHGMQPGKDYDYGFSTSHDESIRLIAASEIKVATVASDMLDRAIGRNDVGADSIREIYTSERFPSAAIGIAHDLEEGLATKIVDAISSFDLSASDLASEIGSGEGARFVPVVYKDEWAIVRRTDDALGVIHALDELRRNGEPESPMPSSLDETGAEPETAAATEGDTD